MNVNEHRFNVNAIGKHRVKKTFDLRERFCFHILKNMVQNNKHRTRAKSHIYYGNYGDLFSFQM